MSRLLARNPAERPDRAALVRDEIRALLLDPTHQATAASPAPERDAEAEAATVTTAGGGLFDALVELGFALGCVGLFLALKPWARSGVKGYETVGGVVALLGFGLPVVGRILTSHRPARTARGLAVLGGILATSGVLISLERLQHEHRGDPTSALIGALAVGGLLGIAAPLAAAGSLVARLVRTSRLASAVSALRPWQGALLLLAIGSVFLTPHRSSLMPSLLDQCSALTLTAMAQAGALVLLFGRRPLRQSFAHLLALLAGVGALLLILDFSGALPAPWTPIFLATLTVHGLSAILGLAGAAAAATSWVASESPEPG